MTGNPFTVNSGIGVKGNGEMGKQLPASVRCPARYELVVRSELGSRFASAFAGMEVHAEGGITRIAGPVQDQAQLHGLLDRIRDLGIELVSVNPIAASRTADRPAAERRGAP
ncbi:MAG: hypothetical protein AB7R89_06395 [Dehalococcoidia bacterium]